MLDRAVARRRVLLLAAATVAVAVTAAATATAELTQKGDLFVHFDGGIAPTALPRDGRAPISVRVEGRIRVPPGQEPPTLRRISISLNRDGRIDTTGLPTCPRERVESANSAEALAACGSSLVGSGGVVAQTSLVGQERSRLRGNVLLFNAVSGGHPAILAYVYQGSPPTTYLIVFSIRHRPGTFGWSIDGKLPPAVNRNGYLESIFLQLERRFTYRGQTRSYLSASCAAPAGFTAAVFPFAKAAMQFDDGRTLGTTLVRTCKVRR